MAVYPGSVASFTNKVDYVEGVTEGDEVMAVDVNELQDEIEAMESELISAQIPGFSYDEASSSGLNFAYRSGRVILTDTVNNIGIVWSNASGSIALFPNKTNYVVITSSGVIDKYAGGGWGVQNIPLYKVVTNASAIVSVTDCRCMHSQMLAGMVLSNPSDANDFAGYLIDKVDNSIEVDTTTLKMQLVGDSATPGNSKYYGTTASGVRGWIALDKTAVGLSSVDNVQQMPLSYLDTDDTLAADSDTKVPSQQAVKAYVLANASSTSLIDYIADIPIGNWLASGINAATLDVDTGSNGNIRRYLFDDTIEEFIESEIRLPSDIDTSGAVTFEVNGYAAIASGVSAIQLKLYHSAVADGESWDAVYGSKESGDQDCNATQDALDFFTWTETVTNLGWDSDDQIRIKISRIAPSGDNLVGDYGLTHVRIRVPRA